MHTKYNMLWHSFGLGFSGFGRVFSPASQDDSQEIRRLAEDGFEKDIHNIQSDYINSIVAFEHEHRKQQ